MFLFIKNLLSILNFFFITIFYSFQSECFKYESRSLLARLICLFEVSKAEKVAFYKFRDERPPSDLVTFDNDIAATCDHCGSASLQVT